MKDRGDHKCLSEHWLIDNLPKGWGYDCHMDGTFGGGQDGFIVGDADTLYEPGAALFIPLDLLAHDRTEGQPSAETRIRTAVEALRGAGKTEEQIIDLVGKVMAETLPEPVELPQNEGLSRHDVHYSDPSSDDYRVP